MTTGKERSQHIHFPLTAQRTFSRVEPAATDAQHSLKKEGVYCWNNLCALSPYLPMVLCGSHFIAESKC